MLEPTPGVTGLATTFFGGVTGEGLVTFFQSPQSTTELVRIFEEKLMLPDLPAELLQTVAADAG